MTKNTVDFQIIANLMAGKGDAKKILTDLKLFLKNHDQTYDVLAIEKPTPISLLPGHNLKIAKGVICVGGDGTISESVGYMINKKLDLPLAVIPTGTANIIASSFGLSGSVLDFNFLLNNNYKDVNVGAAEYGDKKDFFLLGFGLGFEEKFLKMTKEKLKSRLGAFSYILSAFAELISMEKIYLKITSESQQITTNVCTLMILNMPPKLLKFFPLFKEKRFTGDDGYLDLFYVEYKNYFQSIFGTLSLHLFGRFRLGTVKAFSAEEFYLESSQEVSTQLDGELKGKLPVKLSLLPKTFKFFV